MSDNTAKLLPSVINPIAIPETGFLSLTPASISAIVPAHTVAIEDEPLDSSMSETTLTVYGLSSSIILDKALCAKLP